METAAARPKWKEKCQCSLGVQALACEAQRQLESIILGRDFIIVICFLPCS